MCIRVSNCKSKRWVPLSVSSGLTGRLVEGSPGTPALPFACPTHSTTQMCVRNIRGGQLDTDRGLHVHRIVRGHRATNLPLHRRLPTFVSTMRAPIVSTPRPAPQLEERKDDESQPGHQKDAWTFSQALSKLTGSPSTSACSRTGLSASRTTVEQSHSTSVETHAL